MKTSLKFFLIAATCSAIAGRAFAEDGVPAKAEPEVIYTLTGEEHYAPMKEFADEAQAAEEAGKYAKAAKIYLKLASLIKEPRGQAQCLLHRAECYKKANKTSKAYAAYKQLLQRYPLYIPYEEVIQNLIQIAEDFVDGHGTFWGIRDRDEAINIYYMILHETPSIYVSLPARRRLAELLVLSDRKEEAVNVYKEILKLNPALDEDRLKVTQLLVSISKSGDGDGEIHRAAARQARRILKTNPNFERIEEVRQILEEITEDQARRLLENAQFYLRKTQYRPEASRKYLLDLIRDYPGTHAALEGKSLLDTHPSFQNEKTEIQNQKG